MAVLIDGKKVAAKVLDEVSKEIIDLAEQGKETTLAVIIVGDNPASRVYVNNKKKDCAFVGIKSLEYALPENTTQEELNELIDKLNNDETVNGILCQLPLPKHLDEKAVIERISPVKDVDAFHPVNVGHITTGDYKFLPCTPAGIMELLKTYSIDVCGKTCVVIGRSNIVGKPMGLLLMHKDATVTICHSKTRNLSEVTKQADVIVVAVGKVRFLKADMVKDGVVIIDVGMHRDENGKLVGDVDFENVEPKASYITPVPGGVGPMTRAILMKNTLTARKMQ